VPRLLRKYALVTGGSSGIGAACARALADEGAAVVACGRRFARGAVSAPAPGQVVAAHLDVTDEREVTERVDALPELDVLVCSHGQGTFTPIARTSLADVRAMLEVHVLGTLACVREAARRMQARKSGHIVVVGSHAVNHAFAECGGYTAAKAGQVGLARVLATELRSYDVRVTTVLPGATDTPIWDDRPGFDRAKMLKPEDVAGVIVSIVARPHVAVDEIVVTPPAGVL
jgi:NADP-dependent 3-hydroxy acid dehydrogenase YdfG